MINIKNKKDCCGCYACTNSCSKQAIKMVPDEEGFEYPIVNANKCINCGLCDTICPVSNVENEVMNPFQKGFLLQIKDEHIRSESTSGGAFTAIASWVIKMNGVVYGAAFDYTDFKVKHFGVETVEGLGLFRNSKYVQSNLGNIYSEVKNMLRKDRWVCFSGTPCQIEGLIHFLRSKYNKLVLIDVVCYGIPSPGMFKDYINWQKKNIGGEFTKFLFREKILSYNYTSVSIYNEDKSKDYHSGVERDKYMRSFFSNRNIRPSCYDCKFKKRYRISDFTIWDCYDIRKFSKTMDEKGTNRVLVHSAKARMIINEIKDTIKLEEYKDIMFFIKDEVAMTHSVSMPKDRETFFNDYASLSFENFINTWFSDSMKVRLNSWLRLMAFKFGVYNKAKRIVKTILHKN